MNSLLSIFLFWQLGLAAPDTSFTKQTADAAVILQTPKQLTVGAQTDLVVIIGNKKNSEWTGYISLELNDTQTKQAVDGLFANVFPSQYFTVSINDSSRIEFPVSVPNRFPHPVRVTAKLFAQQKLVDSVVAILSYKP